MLSPRSFTTSVPSSSGVGYGSLLASPAGIAATRLPGAATGKRQHVAVDRTPVRASSRWR